MLNKGMHIFRQIFFLLLTFTYSHTPNIYAQAASEINSQVALSQPLTTKWTYESELTTNLTPATDGSRVYLPLASGQLVSLRASDGQLFWKTDLGGELSASPVADERSVYIASETFGEQRPALRANGALRALG